MRGLWLPSLKKWVTGTLVGGKYGLDINVINAAIPVVSAALTLLEYRYHRAADNTVNGSGGAFVQVASAADIANTITQMRVANNSGAPLAFSVGADATAAAAAAPIAVVAAGQTSEAVFGVALAAGDKLWVRSLYTSNVTTGEFVVALLG